VSWRATVFWSLLAAVVGFGLFHVKYQVQTLEDRLAKLNRAIVREQEQIHVLRAEWTYLDRPERIEQLAKKYLELAPPKASQVGSIAQLPMRSGGAPDPASLQSRAQPVPVKPATSAPRLQLKAPSMVVPTPVATNRAHENYDSRPSRPNFAAELSTGVDEAAPLPGGGR
jgi:cell division protein FtsL